MENKASNIHWYPGHMAQALNAVSKILPTVDLVITVGDGRAPVSSLNPYLQSIVKNKTQVLIFSKKDLTDMAIFDSFKVRFDNYAKILTADLTDTKEIKYILSEIMQIKTTKTEKYRRYGLNMPPLRAMVVGIPNVGKSTLINLLAGRKKVSVGNLPGWTRSQQLIKINDKLELLDTPGILPSNYEDKTTSLHLAWLGALKQEILPLDDLSLSLASFMMNKYPENLRARYNVANIDDPHEFFQALAVSRSFKKIGNELDIERAQKIFLKEFQSGILGKVVVDEPQRI